MSTKKSTPKTVKKSAPDSAKEIAPKIEQVDLDHWISTVKDSHDKAIAQAATPSGCCQVQNQQTGGVFQIPTDAATCQAIGGVFIPGPC